MVRLLSAGLARLDAVGEPAPVDLGPLRSDVLRWLEAARRWDEGGERPSLAAPCMGLE